MINFVQPANVIPLTAPKDLASGEGVFIGKVFAICTVAAKSGATFQGLVQGGVSLKKAGGYSPAQGAAAIFDAASQTIISGAGTTVGYVYGPDPDDATRSMVRLIPSAA
jgi:predicted RecA/RadA family phage recombinase